MTTDEARDNEKRIRELSAAPPVALVTKRAKALAIARNIAAVVAFIAMGTAVVALNQQNNATHNTQVAVCQQSNTARAQVAGLWQYIIDQSKKANPHPTARQAQALHDFQVKVDQTYAPRDCAHPGK